MSKSTVVFYLQLIVSLILVGFFFATLEMGNAWSSINLKSWIFIGLTAILVNLDRVLMAFKWNILLKAKKIVLPFPTILKTYYIGTFWGTFLPSSVGGDIVRAYQLSGQTKNFKDVVSSILLERVFGIVCIFLVGMLGLLGFAVFVNNGYFSMALVFVALFFSSLGLVAISLYSKWLGSLKNKIEVWEQSWLSKLGLVFVSYQSFKDDRNAVLKFCFLTVLQQMMPVLCAFLISLALHIEIQFWFFLMFIPIILALSRVPISFDGFGIREGLYVYFFALIGIPSADAFLLGFIAHLVGIVSVFPGFFYFLWASSATPQVV